jgi:ribonuclease J
VALRLLPIGGLGEIGRNCLLVEHGNDALLVDCGVQFPGPDVHGVDLILPDFAPLLARRERLRAILVTHGHEDHLGAIPYLLRELAIPVYASRLTLALLTRKLEELGLTADLRELQPRREETIGSFRVEPLRVTHSIPDSLAFAISCDAGTLLHTGDFKIDHAPLDGEVTDLTRFAELGHRGVVCMLSDSTNAGREGSCPGELSVGAGLREIVQEAPGRVVVGLFSSNLHRLQQILSLCSEAGRRVALNGMSLEKNVELAIAVHRLKLPPDILISHEQAKALEPQRLCILSTGAQGEPRSGLMRLAHGTHGSLHLDAGDRVILSASLIPGNEVAVHGLVNQLARLHIRVFQEPDHAVHVSGHAYRNDQRLLLRLVQPQAFIAIHGEARHLADHRALAAECGVPADQCLEVYDGDWVEIDAAGARVARHEDLQTSFLDRWGGTDVPEEVVRDRRTLANAGLITAIVQLDRASGALLRDIEIVTRGFAAADSNGFYAEASRELTEELTAMPAALKLDLPAVEEAVVRVLRKVAKRTLERRPVILPVVLKL